MRDVQQLPVLPEGLLSGEESDFDDDEIVRHDPMDLDVFSDSNNLLNLLTDENIHNLNSETISKSLAAFSAFSDVVIHGAGSYFKSNDVVIADMHRFLSACVLADDGKFLTNLREKLLKIKVDRCTYNSKQESKKPMPPKVRAEDKPAVDPGKFASSSLTPEDIDAARAANKEKKKKQKELRVQKSISKPAIESALEPSHKKLRKTICPVVMLTKVSVLNEGGLPLTYCFISISGLDIDHTASTYFGDGHKVPILKGLNMIIEKLNHEQSQEPLRYVLLTSQSEKINNFFKLVYDHLPEHMKNAIDVSKLSHGLNHPFHRNCAETKALQVIAKLADQHAGTFKIEGSYICDFLPNKSDAENDSSKPFDMNSFAKKEPCSACQYKRDAIFFGLALISKSKKEESKKLNPFASPIRGLIQHEAKQTLFSPIKHNISLFHGEHGTTASSSTDCMSANI